MVRRVRWLLMLVSSLRRFLIEIRSPSGARCDPAFSERRACVKRPERGGVSPNRPQVVMEGQAGAPEPLSGKLAGARHLGGWDA